MKTQEITLKNDFHNTEYTVRAKIHNGYLYITPTQAHKVWEKLCGKKDCTCPATRIALAALYGLDARLYT